MLKNNLTTIENQENQKFLEFKVKLSELKKFDICESVINRKFYYNQEIEKTQLRIKEINWILSELEKGKSKESILKVLASKKDLFRKNLNIVNKEIESDLVFFLNTEDYDVDKIEKYQEKLELQMVNQTGYKFILSLMKLWD